MKKAIPVSQPDACCVPHLDMDGDGRVGAARAALPPDVPGVPDVMARLKALADPTRLRMLALLVEHDEPLCVCEITPQFDLHQPTVSHHLRLLREAGLADCERRGTWAYYWATAAGRRALAAVAGLA